MSRDQAITRAAQHVVRTAGRGRRWEAKLLRDGELTAALEDWFDEHWDGNDAIPEKLLREARGNLNYAAKSWLALHDPFRLRMHEAARRAYNRERRRALAEGCSEDQARQRAENAEKRAKQRAKYQRSLIHPDYLRPRDPFDEMVFWLGVTQTVGLMNMMIPDSIVRIAVRCLCDSDEQAARRLGMDPDKFALWAALWRYQFRKMFNDETPCRNFLL